MTHVAKTTNVQTFPEIPFHDTKGASTYELILNKEFFYNTLY